MSCNMDAENLLPPPSYTETITHQVAISYGTIMVGIGHPRITPCAIYYRVLAALLFVSLIFLDLFIMSVGVWFYNSGCKYKIEWYLILLGFLLLAGQLYYIYIYMEDRRRSVITNGRTILITFYGTILLFHAIVGCGLVYLSYHDDACPEFLYNFCFILSIISNVLMFLGFASFLVWSCMVDR